MCLLPELGFEVNPTVQQMEESKLDLIMAETESAVLMIEGYCDFLTEHQLLEVSFLRISHAVPGISAASQGHLLLSQRHLLLPRDICCCPRDISCFPGMQRHIHAGGLKLPPPSLLCSHLDPLVSKWLAMVSLLARPSGFKLGCASDG